MQKIVIKTSKQKEVKDLTEAINNILKKGSFGNGLCHLFVKHTTCALTVADLDPGTDEDYLDAYEAMVPKLKYRHPHDPSHVSDHILSALIGTSVNVPVKNSKLELGTWQRVVLVEFSGPRERHIVINFIS